MVQAGRAVLEPRRLAIPTRGDVPGRAALDRRLPKHDQDDTRTPHPLRRRPHVREATPPRTTRVRPGTEYAPLIHPTAEPIRASSATTSAPSRIQHTSEWT